MLMQNFGGQIRFIIGNVAVAYQSENTGIGQFFGDHKILLFLTQSLKYHIDIILSGTILFVHRT